jgi:hypothetical protein
MTYVHINWTHYSQTRCEVIDCPTCNRQRRALAQFQEWYGWTITCAGCGEQWYDGERGQRPFIQGWRKQNIEEARAALQSIGVQA